MSFRLSRTFFLLSLAGQLLTTMSLSGCSVKENRNLCPCHLTLHLESSSEDLGRTVLLFNGFSSHFRDTLDYDTEKPFQWKLARERMRILAVSPLVDEIQEDGCIFIEPGNGCPPVYMGRLSFDSLEEQVEDTLYLYKNHCVLSIQFSLPWGNAFENMDMRIKGQVNGYDAFGEPLEGNYEVRLEPDEYGRCQICVPRQIDGSLSLDVMTGEETIRSFAIGSYMEEAGYDWGKDNLADCSMNVDISLTSFDFTIALWKKSVSMKIIV